MSKRKKPARIAVIDFETDPFQYGRLPKVFAAGFFDGETYCDFWGVHAVIDLLHYLATRRDRLRIYAHNGGKFDFFYLIDMLENPVKIINGRIVSAMLGKHELRDSYAIIPVPLAAHDKGSIDYALFERDQREENRNDILDYLARDCESLYSLVAAFNDRFGDKLTIGGTAMGILKEMHPFVPAQQSHDEKFREFYFGGRVSAFRTGIITGQFRVVDVNSMYPNAMRNYKHPTGRFYARPANPRLDKHGKLIGFGGRPYFIDFTGCNKSALPTRTKEGLNFDIPHGRFKTMSHEVEIALKHGLIEIEEIHDIWVPVNTISFEQYVDTYIAEKVAAKKGGNKIAEIFSKLLLNSAY